METQPAARSLYSNTTGQSNTSTGYRALIANTTGFNNTGTGVGALTDNATGSYNTADGGSALSRSAGSNNAALGYNAGLAATTGSYILFLGANVQGTNADTNTIRIGLPYDGFGEGQNKTFIAGIHGTPLTGSYPQVVVDANGQLGTLTPPVQLSGGATATPPSVMQQQVQEQQVTIDDLRSRLARVEALLKAVVGRR